MTELLTILADTEQPHESAAGETTVLVREARRWLREGGRRRLRCADRARLLCARLEMVPRPFLAALILRAAARGRCWFEDERGERLELGPLTIARLGREQVASAWRSRTDVKAAWGRIPRMARSEATRHLDWNGAALYLYTEPVAALPAGGSVGHIAGVAGNLSNHVSAVRMIASVRVPTLSSSVEVTLVEPPGPWHQHELMAMRYNELVLRAAESAVASESIAFIYQRLSLFNGVGPILAERLGVPLVVEFNGSEVWVSRKWSEGSLRHEDLAAATEDAMLHAADLIVVVSRPLVDQLVEMGIPEERVLLNPNGVDPDRYRPNLDGGPVRARLGLGDHTVIGFIGTFGRWHGAEVLAEAYGRLLGRRPDLRSTSRLLLIGDGLTMPEVRDAIERHEIGDACVLTGRVPQAEGPAHLAACDLLASPHVPNADGSPFFGSPTKLFEYMAMGRGIVASSLGQIADLLEHERTALMVTPGDAEELSAGLERLLDDPDLRARLGAAARAEACTHHTWAAHTRRIVERLERFHPRASAPVEGGRG